MAEQKLTRYRPVVRITHPITRKPVSEHVLKAEIALGRKLPKGAEVHHVNGNPADNRNTNLVICQDNRYHNLLHIRQRVKSAGGDPDVDKICGHCKLVKHKSEFARDKSDFHGIHSRCRKCDSEMRQARRHRGYQLQPKYVLSDAAVLDIRSSRESLNILAVRYGVSLTTVRLARLGRRYQHVQHVAAAVSDPQQKAK